MGGEGYALNRARALDSASRSAQVRSKAKRARSEIPRHRPSGENVVSKGGLADSMDEVMLQAGKSLQALKSSFRAVGPSV